MYTRRPRPRPRSPDNPGPPFSALRSERRNVPSHWVCTTSANGVQGQGAGKATTPEDKTSSSEDEDKPGITSGSTVRVERAASCERRSEKDDSEGVCEAATGAKIARRRANVDVDVDVDVSSWRGRPYVCVGSWGGGWETSGLGNFFFAPYAAG